MKSEKRERAVDSCSFVFVVLVAVCQDPLPALRDVTIRCITGPAPWMRKRNLVACLDATSHNVRFVLDCRTNFRIMKNIRENCFAAFRFPVPYPFVIYSTRFLLSTCAR